MSTRTVISDCHALMGMLAFVFLVYAWIDFNRKEFELQKNLGFLVFLTLIIASIGFGEDIIFSLSEAIEKFVRNDGRVLDKYVEAMSELQVEGSWSDFIIAECIGFMLPMTRICLWLVMQIMDLLQTVMLWIGFALSPLMLAFMTHPVTRGIGTRYITSIFSVMLWPIGFIIAEMSFLVVLKSLASSGIADLVIVGRLSENKVPDAAIAPFLAVAVILATGFLIVMYVVAPVLITILLNGASPGAMLGAAAGSMLAGSKQIAGGSHSATMMAGRTVATAATAGGSVAGAVGGALVAPSVGKAISSAGRGVARAANASTQPLLVPSGGPKAGLSSSEVATVKQQMAGHEAKRRPPPKRM
jgi:hypothetical protein